MLQCNGWELLSRAVRAHPAKCKLDGDTELPYNRVRWNCALPRGFRLNLVHMLGLKKDMDLAEARSIIAAPNSSFADKFAAASVIVGSESVETIDLLSCLELGGVIAEMAAMRLHMITGRARDHDKLGVYLDRSNWEAYLSHE